MSLFGEFYVPAESFALHHTLRELPETVIETERVVATEEVLTPYFWVTTDDISVFESVVADDPSVEDLRRLDTFDRSTLYRAMWTQYTGAILFMYTQVGAIILAATGHHDEWCLEIRFDERDDLVRFREYYADRQIPFRLTKLHALTTPRTEAAYGLTEKQFDALLVAWEMGYFTEPGVTLRDVAVQLDIAPQSLSERLNRGHAALIENTLTVTPPE